MYASSNGTLLAGGGALVRFLSPPALAPGQATFVLSTAAATAAARPISATFIYARPRIWPPTVLDWAPRTVFVGAQISVNIRLSGVPDVDPAASYPGGGSGGWLPGLSLVVIDSIGKPRTITARLLSTDGAGSATIALASARGDAWNISGMWNVTLALQLDLGGVGVTGFAVFVYEVPPPQVRSFNLLSIGHMNFNIM
jgi:hypothetical protein